VLAAVNAALLAEEDPGELRFVTACCVLLSPDPRGATAVVALAGHPSPLLRTADGAVREVGCNGLPLGIQDDAAFSEVTVDMPRGSTLVLYTDGVTEARDASREFYPLDERVKALAPQARAKLTKTGKIRANGAAPSLLDLVRDDLLRYVGAPPDDDAALLLVRAPSAWPGVPSVR
jgi:serine phosphatase RsbU (regulator of sigma subunit)